MKGDIETPDRSRKPMRFMTIYKPANTARMEAGLPPSPDEIARMGAFIEQMVKSGALLATDGLQPSSKGAKVRKTGSKVVIIDGPFTEAKELIGGFAILRAASKAEAIELSKQFLEVAGDGEVEVRQMPDQPAFIAKE
jgi:hypothetical protein